MPRHIQGQRREVGGAVQGGARLRRAEGKDGAGFRTVGIARARTKIGLANLAYNMKRLVWLQGTTAPA